MKKKGPGSSDAETMIIFYFPAFKCYVCKHFHSSQVWPRPRLFTTDKKTLKLVCLKAAQFYVCRARRAASLSLTTGVEMSRLVSEF